MKQYETSDVNLNALLVTSWYTNDYMQCKMAIERVAKNLGFKIVGSNDVYKEILVVNSSFDLVVKVTTVNPRESGIDFCVTRKGLFANVPKQIDLWYTELNKQLQFKGKGLHKNGF